MDENKLNDQLRLAVALAKGYVIKRWTGITTGTLYAMVVPRDEYVDDTAVEVDQFPDGMNYSFHPSIPDYPGSFRYAHELLEEVNASRDWFIEIFNCMDSSWFVLISNLLGPSQDCTGQNMSLCRAICEAYVLWCEKKGKVQDG